MSEPFLAEIRIVGFNLPPRGWAQCDGQILPINQNQSLYSLLGTIYGGDGRTSFALPDLRGRVPIHSSTSFNQGSRGGEERHTLNASEMPAHTHSAGCTNKNPTSRGTEDNIWAAQSKGTNFGTSAPGATLDSRSISNAGSGSGHENMQPFLVLNFVIAIQGLFPSRN